MPNSNTIAQIVVGCIRSDRQSQKEFYKKFYDFSMGICIRYCSRDEEAVEVVNDAFLKIFRSLHKFVPRYDDYELSLFAWMKTIVIHTAIDHFRKNGSHYMQVEVNNLQQEINPALNALDVMSYKELIGIVQKLSPVYRTVFNLAVIEGYRHEEIASQLNISIGTSKSNLSKAKQNIQKLLTEFNPGIYEQRTV